MYPPDDATAATEAFFDDFTLEPSSLSYSQQVTTEASQQDTGTFESEFKYLNSNNQEYQQQVGPSTDYFSQAVSTTEMQSGLGLQGDFGAHSSSPTPSQLSTSLKQQSSAFMGMSSGQMSHGMASGDGWSLAESGQGLRRVNIPVGPLDSFESVASSEASSSQMSSIPERRSSQMTQGNFSNSGPMQEGQSLPMNQSPATYANNMPVFGSPVNATLPQPISMPTRQYPGASSPAQPFINSPTVMSPLSQSVYSTSPHSNLLSHSLPVTQQMMLFYSQQSLSNARANFRNLSLLAQSPTLPNISSPSMGEMNSFSAGFGQSSMSDSKSIDGKDYILPADKKERNRLAAERCRKKKAELIQQLTMENQLLRQENGELIKINLVLEQKLDYLINILSSYGISIPK